MNSELINKKTKVTYDRRRRIQLKLIVLIVILFVFSLKSFATENEQTIKFAEADSLIDKAVNLFYQKKFDEAFKICDYVIQKYPENPLGYLGAAGVYHLLMLNYRVSLYDHKFDSLTSLAIKAGEKAIKKYRNDANAYFVLGAAYGFRGLNRIRKSEWLSAFYDGLKGISNIKKAHKLKRDLYDVYYALGLFYYWKSVKAKILTHLGMMKDEREKGIQYLKIAIEKGKLASLEGKFALIEIYYYEDRYEEALKECESLKENFFHDPTWNYLIAKILGKLSKWEESKTYFVKLLALLDEFPHKSFSYLAECHYGIAKCAYEMKDYDTAREELTKALELSNHWDKKREIEGPLLDFDKVLKRMKILKKQLENLNQNQ